MVFDALVDTVVIQWTNFTVAKRFRLTPASAASSVNSLCTSGGTRTMNSPLEWLSYSNLSIALRTCLT